MKAKLESLIRTPGEAIAEIRSGDVVMVGGFGLVGSPLTLIAALIEDSDANELTIVSNNIGKPGEGLGKLLHTGRISRAIGSYFTSNPDVIELEQAGKLEVELLPQGTLAEAIRAGGAGIGGFYTKTAVGTLLAEGGETREIEGESYLFQRGLSADVALVRAGRGDKLGNLSYTRTARNFNPDMATAANLVIAEVDAIAEVGGLGPHEIDTPHLYVDHLVEATVTI